MPDVFMYIHAGKLLYPFLRFVRRRRNYLSKRKRLFTKAVEVNSSGLLRRWLTYKTYVDQTMSIAL